ncbi:MAG: hypothetical protein P1P82_07430 [Bacteroidales bacterium]|nr:hypothetical protein [Bacteroidales bacterium]MDT8431446.1 hypothetical protein [Bacteroidales bacterium]
MVIAGWTTANPTFYRAGLLLLLIPAILHFSGSMELDQIKNLMLVGTVVWFIGAIPWLGKKTKEE